MVKYLSTVLSHYNVVPVFQDPFKTFGKSFVKTTVMATGEFDYTNMLIDGLGQNNNHSGILVPLIPFPEVSTVFFYIFMLTMPIVLMNLLVRLRIVCRGGEGSYDPTGLLSYRLQRIFLHLHADHADCAYEPTGKIEDCM